MREFRGEHCHVLVEKLPGDVLRVTIAGQDIGEHGNAPMLALEALMPAQSVLFIDARAATGPSTDVSAAWAQWLAAHRERFSAIHMLTATRFLQMTAEFVKKFAALGERMCIYTDAETFDSVLRS
jgi:hypothetical protein